MHRKNAIDVFLCIISTAFLHVSHHTHCIVFVAFLYLLHFYIYRITSIASYLSHRIRISLLISAAFPHLSRYIDCLRASLTSIWLHLLHSVDCISYKHLLHPFDCISYKHLLHSVDWKQSKAIGCKRCYIHLIALHLSQACLVPPVMRVSANSKEALLISTCPRFFLVASLSFEGVNVLLRV